MISQAQFDEAIMEVMGELAGSSDAEIAAAARMYQGHARAAAATAAMLGDSNPIEEVYVDKNGNEYRKPAEKEEETTMVVPTLAEATFTLINTSRKTRRNLPVEGDIVERIAYAVRCANDRVESGKQGELKLVFRTDAQDYVVTYTFDRIMELDEILDPHVVPMALYAWVDSLDLPVDEEEVRPHGASWVHLTVMDESDDEVLGRVTACIMPRSESELMVSLAFCHRRDNFSRKRGRILSSERMRDLHVVLPLCNSRFDTVRGYIEDIMAMGESFSVIDSGPFPIEFPPWCLPAPHKDIPEEIVSLLQRISEGHGVEPRHVELAKKYLGLTGRYQTKIVMHRDNVRIGLDK